MPPYRSTVDNTGGRSKSERGRAPPLELLQRRNRAAERGHGHSHSHSHSGHGGGGHGHHGERESFLQENEEAQGAFWGEN